MALHWLGETLEGSWKSSFRHCWRCALRDNVYSINTSIWRGKELGIWELYLYILVCGTHCWFNLVRGNNFKAIKLVERHCRIHWGIFGIVLHQKMNTKELVKVLHFFVQIRFSRTRVSLHFYRVNSAQIQVKMEWNASAITSLLTTTILWLNLA